MAQTHFARLLVFAAGLVLSSTLAHAQNAATGKWTLDIDSPQGATTAGLTLSVEGDVVKGTLAGDMGELPITGKLVDGQVSFSFDFAGPSGPITIITKATVSGDEMKGEMDYGQYFRLSDEELLVRIPSVDGVSEQERAEIDHQVALLTDRNSGREGMVAIDWLVKRKKRAMPSLLSWFEGKTFDNEEQQWAAHQVQQVLRDIVKAEPMPSDLFARFNPGMTTPKEHFRRAAKMWVAQWNAVLSKKETFKGYDEEE